MCNIAFIVTTDQRSHLLKDLIWRGTGLLEASQSQACVFRWLSADRSVVRRVDKTMFSEDSDMENSGSLEHV